MPSNVIIGLAQQSKKSEKEVENAWEKAKKIYIDDTGNKESGFKDKDWKIITKITKNILGIKESFEDSWVKKFLENKHTAKDFFENKLKEYEEINDSKVSEEIPIKESSFETIILENIKDNHIETPHDSITFTESDLKGKKSGMFILKGSDHTQEFPITEIDITKLNNLESISTLAKGEDHNHQIELSYYGVFKENCIETKEQVISANLNIPEPINKVYKEPNNEEDEDEEDIDEDGGGFRGGGGGGSSFGSSDSNKQTSTSNNKPKKTKKK